MTPFHPDLENDAGHTIDQSDLIAFHLHELSSPQERAVRRVLHTHPALQTESLAIAATLRAFPKHEASLPLDAAALDRQWLALRSSLPIHDAPSIPRRSFFTRWALPTLAVSALAATALIVSLYHNPRTAPSTLATTITPPMAATPSNSVPSSMPVPLYNSIPTHSSIPTASIFPARILDSPTPQAANTIPSNTSQAQPTPNQPISSPARVAASPASASIATNQQPTSLSSATPASPTAPSNARPSSRTHHDHTTDITLAVIGNLTPDRSFTSTAGTGASTVTASYTQETTPSVGALAAFHQQLRPWLGYRITAAYSEPTFQYVYSASPSSVGNIVNQHAYELSGTYVIDGPRHRRISTSAEAGAGLLALLPANTNLTAEPVGNTFHPAGVFGVSTEFTLSKHLAIHAGYRGLLYKAPAAYPTYGTTVPPAPNNLTLSSEPVIGLTYRFHTASE